MGKLASFGALLIVAACAESDPIGDRGSALTAMVTDVEALYAAVNLGAEGDTVRLAPGVYNLSATTPGDPSVPRPNGGRLELKPGMSLIGPGTAADLDRWDTGEPDPRVDAIIDAAALPASSYMSPPIQTGAVRAGPRNLVHGVVIRKSNGVSGLECDLLPPGDEGMSVTIANNLIYGGQRGIDLRNLGTAFNGRRSVFVVVNNVLRDNVLGDGAQGIRLVHNRGCTGATISALLVGNRLHDNVAGLLCESLSSTVFSTSHDRYEILSVGNRYSANHVGLWIGTSVGGTGNDARVTSVQDAILDNDHPTTATALSYTVGGGVVATAGMSADPSAGFGPLAVDNHARVDLVATRFARGDGPGNHDGATPRDLTGYGGMGFDGFSSGSGNELEIHLVHVHSPLIALAPSNDGSSANTVTCVETPPSAGSCP